MLLTITVSTLAPDTAHQIYALVRAFAAAAASRCGTPARSVVAFGAAVEAFPGIGFPTGSTTCASRILRRVAGLAHAANRIARHDHHIETPDLPSPRMIEILGEGTTCADPELEARWIAVRWTTPYHAIAIASRGASRDTAWRCTVRGSLPARASCSRSPRQTGSAPPPRSRAQVA